MSWSRCFSSLGCPDATLDEALALAAKHALPAVELRTLEGTADLPALFARRFQEPAALAAHVRRQPVAVAALNTSLRLIDGKPEDRDAFLTFVPWAEALGSRYLRVFDGGKGGPGDLDKASEVLAWWRALRSRHGWRVDMMIETHDSLFTAAAINGLLARVPDAPILWDAHHTWMKGGEDPVVTWRAIRAAVVHIHVKDSIRVASAKHPYTYVLPGDGAFPIAPLLVALRADDYPGLVSLEWEKMWHPYLPGLDEALTTASARRWW